MAPRLDLTTRRRQPELMDQPALDEAAHNQALRGLARINGISNSPGILWPWIRRLAFHRKNQPLKLLDVASGAGDIPIALWYRAQQQNIPLSVEGCDFSPVAIRFAQAEAQRFEADVTFTERDVLGQPLPTGFDIVTCSLFMHHLAEDQTVALLQSMQATGAVLILINDLRRCKLGHCAARIAPRLVTRSKVVHNDATLSVEGAYTIEEMAGLARQAGMTTVRLMRRWPFRFLMVWERVP